jgi:SAM-dependent methyltransferase
LEHATSRTRDPWLARWLPLIAERAAGLPVLELGCGGGWDSAVLAAAGHRVVGIDLSAQRIERARQAVPSGEFHCQDIQAPFPSSVRSAGVVVASLSLHYFPWRETAGLVERIRSTLTRQGVLLCRLNSINDHYHGASGHPPIAENFYLVDGQPKRFFDRASIDKLFVGDRWSVVSIEETMIDRYDHPKAAWETVLEKKP